MVKDRDNVLHLILPPLFRGDSFWGENENINTHTESERKKSWINRCVKRKLHQFFFFSGAIFLCACVFVCNFFWPTVNRKLYERNFTLRVDAHAHCNLAVRQNFVSQTKDSIRCKSVNCENSCGYGCLKKERINQIYQPNATLYFQTGNTLMCA